MNVQELAKLVSKETGEPTYRILKILNSAFSIIRKEILRAQIIKIKNLLTIFIDVVQEKNKYNINTNIIEKIPRRFVLKVKPSVLLKKQINEKKTY
jgi:nucleoid DNA-binding protein